MIIIIFFSLNIRHWKDKDGEELPYLLVQIFDTRTGCQVSEHKFAEIWPEPYCFETWCDHSWLVAISYYSDRDFLGIKWAAEYQYIIAINTHESICKQLNLQRFRRKDRVQLGAVDVKVSISPTTFEQFKCRFKFLSARKLAPKLLIKCRWNWPQNGKMLFFDSKGFVFVIDLKSEALLFKVQIRYGRFRCPWYQEFGRRARAVVNTDKKESIRFFQMK